MSTFRILPRWLPLALLAILATASLLRGSHAKTSGGSISLSADRQLFLDDYLIADIQNLKRVLNRPTKYSGNPILSPERPWEFSNTFVGNGPGVIFDQKKQVFKMWYNPYNLSKDWDEFYNMCYATSRDGVRWERPNIDLIEYQGSKKNNIVALGNKFIASPSVIEDPRDPDPSRRFKAIFCDQKSTSKDWGFSVAFSPDGIRWTLYPDNPLLTVGSDAVSDTYTLLGWDSRYEKYVAYLRPGIKRAAGVRTIGVSESDDFVHWPPPEIVLRPDEKDPIGTELYAMPTLPYQGAYVGLLWIYHNEPHWPWPRNTRIPDDQLTGLQQHVDTQLAFSRDGRHWYRAGDRQTFLPVGPKGSWDEGQVYPTTPIVVGDEIWIFYSGLNVLHTFESIESLGQTINGKKKQGAIGLAKMRLDGFVSIDATETDGTLLTKPLRFEGKQMVINADARSGVQPGYLRVEVQDQEEKPVADFQADICDPITDDSIHHTVSWKGKTDLSVFRGKTVRFRFVLKHAKLYSFQVQ